MKRFIPFILLVFVIQASLSAQSNLLRWVSHGSSPNALMAEGVTTDPSGNAYVTGYFNTYFAWEGDTLEVVSPRNSMYFAKISPQQEVLWQVTAQADGIQGVTGFKSVYRNGFVYLMGDLRGTATFTSMDFSDVTVSGNDFRTMYVAKYTDTGILEWVRTLTTNNSSGFTLTGGTHDLAVDHTGAVYISTQFRNNLNIAGVAVADPTPGENLFNALVAKLDANGAYQWHWTSTHSGADQGQAINIRNNNELYVAVRYSDSLSVGGHISTRAGQGGLALIQFDLAGNYQWHRFMETQSNLATGVRCFSMEFSTDNHIYLAGSYRTDIVWGVDTLLATVNESRTDGFIIKIDAEDKLWQWGKAYGDPAENDEIKSVLVSADQDLFFTGIFRGTMQLTDDLELVATGTSADGFWAMANDQGEPWDGFAFGGVSNVVLTQAALSPLGEYFVMGRFQNLWAYADVELESWNSFDMFLLKLSPASSNASLAEIFIDDQMLDGFDPQILQYEFALDNDVQQVPMVSATLADLAATLEIVQAQSIDGEETQRTATLTVTAEDGETLLVYEVVFRYKRTNTLLEALFLDGEAVEGFNPLQNDYYFVIPSLEAIPAITAITHDPAASYQVIDPDPDMEGSPWIVYIVLVTAEDTAFEQEYSISFREIDTNARLLEITLDDQPLAGFNPETFQYTIVLPPGTEQMPQIQAVAESEFAQVIIIPAESLSGTEAQRTASVVVTAEDETTILTYTILFSLDDTGINEWLHQAGFVYPNPARESIWVRGEGIHADLEIVSLEGKVVIRVSVNGGEKISVEHLPPGVYLLRLVHSHSVLFQQKLIVQ